MALVEVEQLFPLPENEIEAIIKAYPNAEDYVWAQEEPANMGAWSYMLMNFAKAARLRLASPKRAQFACSRKQHALKLVIKFLEQCL